ncbi:MAG: hypothetical protein ACC619_03675 [Paracoccaceae bacterium]
MLQLEALSPTSPTTVPNGAMALPVGLIAAQTNTPRMFEVGFSAVEMDGRNLWREPAEIAFGQLDEAVQLAQIRGKSELLICNITPWIKVGHDKTSQVPEIESHILEILAAVYQFRGQNMPPCRLDLQNGEFGIRCYLGRSVPTDHIFAEDQLSDSR